MPIITIPGRSRRICAPSAGKKSISSASLACFRRINWTPLCSRLFTATSTGRKPPAGLSGASVAIVTTAASTGIRSRPGTTATTCRGLPKKAKRTRSRRWSIWCARPRRRWPGSRRWRRCRSRTRLCCARPPRPLRSTGWEPRWDAATMSNALARRPGRGRWWAGISPMALTNGIRKPWFCSATIIVSSSSGIRTTTG